MIKVKNILIITILISIIINFATVSIATVTTITDADLAEALKKFESTESNEENYKFSVSNNVINMASDSDTYEINYNLTEKPTFTCETLVEEGMSYEEFENETNALFLIMLGYIAISDIQGVKMEDAMMYFMFSYLESAFKQSSSNQNTYVIIDDLKGTNGVTVEKTDDPNTIYTSEFGNRVMEYVNEIYKDKHTITDSTGINSYIYTIEKQNITEKSCKLIATLNVNLDADFSKLNGYSDSPINSGITKENADYKVTLKVGQKCKIDTTEKITGYTSYDGHIEVSEDCTEITAKSVGVSTMYLKVGDTKKTMYITVEENEGNASLDTVILKIATTNKTEQEENNNKNENISTDNTNASNTNIADNTQANKDIPKTGSNYTIKRTSLGIIFIATTVLVFLVMYDKRIGMKDETK